ncbi:MAG TPA: hypothetical protein VLA87_00440 [Gaiellaceae bacterium]|nr:hypothetical protein [Gaiellaceae bacterium]
MVVPSEPSAITTANAPAKKAPMYGMYAQTNVTIAIVPASGTQSSSAPTPTTTPLNAATIVTPAKYCWNEFDHAAGDRPGDRLRDARMAFDPGAQRRAVLQEEEEAEEEEGERQRERRKASDAGDEAVHEGGDHLRYLFLGRRARALGSGGADPDVVEPPLRLVGGGGRVGRDVVGLGDDPADHEDADDDSDDQEEQERDRRGPSPPDPVTSQPAHERQRDAGDHERRDHGLRDLGRRSDEPDQADEQEDRAEKQPGCKPEVAQPARRREDRRQLPELVLVELDDVSLVATRRLSRRASVVLGLSADPQLAFSASVGASLYDRRRTVDRRRH